MVRIQIISFSFTSFLDLGFYRCSRSLFAGDSSLSGFADYGKDSADVHIPDQCCRDEDCRYRYYYPQYMSFHLSTPALNLIDLAYLVPTVALIA